MPKTHLTIIGINPGTRYLGIAVFQGTELMDWRVKTFKGKWSKGKMEKIIGAILEIIELYEPDALAVKKLHPSRRSENLARLTIKIKELARRKGLRVYQYSIKDLEDFFVENEKLNKRNLAEAVLSRYPDLSHELNKEKSHKNPYHIRAIEAVALASICLSQMDKR
jgi:Holliday junction resolvasome RuvABC endonuclease subunit